MVCKFLLLSVIVFEAESGINEQSSNFRWVCCIHFHTTVSRERHGAIFSLPSYGLNSRIKLGFQVTTSLREGRKTRFKTVEKTTTKLSAIFPKNAQQFTDNKEK